LAGRRTCRESGLPIPSLGASSRMLEWPLRCPRSPRYASCPKDALTRTFFFGAPFLHRYSTSLEVFPGDLQGFFEKLRERNCHAWKRSGAVGVPRSLREGRFARPSIETLAIRRRQALHGLPSTTGLSVTKKKTTATSAACRRPTAGSTLSHPDVRRRCLASPWLSRSAAPELTARCSRKPTLRSAEPSCPRWVEL